MIRTQKTGTLASIQRRGRRWGLLSLLAISPALTGCYGHFPLTHAVLKMNGEVSSNGVIQSIVTWIFVLLPVYWFAEVIDFFVMNLIEFWSGDSITLSQGTDSQGNTVTLAPSADGTEAKLTVTRDGRTLQEGAFIRTSGGDWVIVDAKGAVQGRVVNAADGSIEIRNAEGKTMRTIPADAVKLAHEKRAQAASQSQGAPGEAALVF